MLLLSVVHLDINQLCMLCVTIQDFCSSHYLPYLMKFNYESHFFITQNLCLNKYEM